jgi:hypothetical protein
MGMADVSRSFPEKVFAELFISPIYRIFNIQIRSIFYS